MTNRDIKNYNKTFYHLNNPEAEEMIIRDDPRLSSPALGILLRLYLKFRAKDNIITKFIIQEESGMGRVMFFKAWKELEKYGYVKMKRIRGGVQTDIYEYGFEGA